MFLCKPLAITQSNDGLAENDNLRNEYQALFEDVPKSVPFARIALERDPDAINFWLGNSRSTTALHKDPYENIYVQVLGQKHFVLLPPVASACVNNQEHPAATYQVAETSSGVAIESINLQPVLDEPPSTVPFATWDPDMPEQNATAFSSLVTPLSVTLAPGDMLYLPAMWW
jgi:jumonji domain-containing protein 7